MLTEAQIIEILRRVNPRLDAKTITPTATLDELALDSLDRFILLGELQEATGIEIPDDDVPQLTSLRAIHEYLAARSG